ncbi:MAG: dethiobiotin synthase, partial [Xanthobacteraceae bacterium]
SVGEGEIKMTAIFITSTGTDIGKTFVAAGLIRHLRRTGRAAAAIKPIVSGFDSRMAQSSDPGLLLAAMGRAATPEEIANISPWRFQAALSPDFAARREGRSIDFSAVVEFSQRAIDANETLFIEGVGGVMVPLDTRRTVLDWMTALRLPLILVVGSYLGTLSHSLTALHVLAQRNLSTAAVVVSETPDSPAPLDETVAAIARFADMIEVIGLPRLAPDAPEHPAFARLAELLRNNFTE